MQVLIVNTGSSSVKLSVLGEGGEQLGNSTLELRDGTVTAEQMQGALEELPRVDAVGHRVVHGGEDFRAPVVLDEHVLDRIRDVAVLAPLHVPKALAGIEAARKVLPDTPQVACFDTAFHATLPPEAYTYAIPKGWRERHGLRRYGFHGLSHSYASRRAAEMAGGPVGRLVVAHLGAGASLSAVRDGRCLDTTMGFTPTEGLVMATRSGDVDPGLVLWLLQYGGMAPDEVAGGLDRGGGLYGLTGDSDMRDVMERVGGDDPVARLGLGVYLHRLRAKIAAMAAALNGLDTLVFTGGVGEHQPPVRAGAAEGLAFLGVALDTGANEGARTDTDITAPGANVRTLVITAREDLEIDGEVRRTLEG
ncbi:acetate/propionate family kinase [Nocardiopsis sp. RSe5-2]|uniref:Acetate kinase n=1 Tax=Nocardiopsis endophytica TaxID=3018445 RepID=A0ABT4UC15_9ACTN|nr:acetate/propionate family kinase [Nocardiopsis endophytica]MDA2814511.1 acetate/propionate family kinase [Nocardiopsis endophytica]